MPAAIYKKPFLFYLLGSLINCYGDAVNKALHITCGGQVKMSAVLQALRD